MAICSIGEILKERRNTATEKKDGFLAKLRYVTAPDAHSSKGFKRLCRKQYKDSGEVFEMEEDARSGAALSSRAGNEVYDWSTKATFTAVSRSASNAGPPERRHREHYFDSAFRDREF